MNDSDVFPTVPAVFVPTCVVPSRHVPLPFLQTWPLLEPRDIV